MCNDGLECFAAALRVQFCYSRRGEDLRLHVDAPVQIGQQGREVRFQRLADPQDRLHRDWPTGLELLPMLARESEQDHVFLRQPAVRPHLAQFTA